MGDLMDRIFGFLPHKAMFWFAIATAVSIYLFQYLHAVVERILILPWEKPENQQKRNQIKQKNQ